MLRFLMWLMMCLVAVSPMAAAQETKADAPPLLMLSQFQPAHPERVLLTFHKVANIEPDFLSWAKKSPFLNDAKAMDRDAIVSREDNRLRRSWAELDMSEPLVVHTTVHLDDYSTIQEKLNLSEFTPRTFFSYSLYGESVAIVPKGIAGFGTLALPKDQMDDMLEKAGGGQVTAELLLKPVVADAKQPFLQDGKAYWLLLAEIGEIRFWANKAGSTPQLVWMHRADWYKPKENSTLMKLKDELQ